MGRTTTSFFSVEREGLEIVGASLPFLRSVERGERLGRVGGFSATAEAMESWEDDLGDTRFFSDEAGKP